MTKLNCAVGDLAITVDCQFPQNLGKIVHVIAGLGLEEWSGHAEPVYTWQVEIANVDSYLHYQYEGEELKRYKTGPVPDCYLRRLTPHSGYLLTEFLDAEQLQLDLYLHEPLHA